MQNEFEIDAKLSLSKKFKTSVQELPKHWNLIQLNEQGICQGCQETEKNKKGAGIEVCP